MNFATYLNQAWQDHGSDPQRVSTEFSEGLACVESGEQLAQWAGLVTHVMGEHLGRWTDGVSYLESLRSHAQFVAGSETEKVMQRSVASLSLCANAKHSLSPFQRSDQIRILATASSALSGRDSKTAKEFLLNALHLAGTELNRDDPANRALAITGNNLACALEEKKSLSVDEVELMILAAQTGRAYWERVGTWLEVSRAEYRLAMSHLQAGRTGEAFEHARACLELCQTNSAGDLDLFFAHEALAKSEQGRKNEFGYQKAIETVHAYFDKLSPEDQTWCEANLKKLTSHPVH